MTKVVCLAIAVGLGVLVLEKQLQAGPVAVPAGSCKTSIRSCGVGDCTTPANCKTPDDCLC